ncbi:MAG TPA: hypothetical protein VGO62_15840 [Myxococcota bacterium]
MRPLLLFSLASPLLLVLACASGCRSPLLRSDVVVSGDKMVTAHVPQGDGWHCQVNDADKTSFQQRGVKCIQDTGLVLNARVLDVETNDARTAKLFCIQDWKEEYQSVFSGVQSYTHDVVDWRGVPACQVVIDGASAKGAWHLWELHAPNGRRLLEITVSGLLPLAKKEQPTVDAWLADLKYDLTLPGQTLPGQTAPGQTVPAAR